MQGHKYQILQQKTFGSGVNSSTGNIIAIMDNENGLICCDEDGIYQYKIEENSKLNKVKIFNAERKFSP